MLKGNEFIGLPVVAYDTGEKIKTIENLVVDRYCNLIGFLVNSPCWAKEVLPYYGIKVIGTEAVIALSQSAIVRAKQVPPILNELKNNLAIEDTKILTESGRNLGVMSDAYFNPEDGSIEGYEVRGGVFAEQSFGKSFVPAVQNMKMGRDVAFVPDEVEKMMQEKVSFQSSHVQKNNNSGVLECNAQSEIYQSSTIKHDREVISESNNGFQLNLDTEQKTASTSAQPIDPNFVTTLEPLLGRRVLHSFKTKDNIYIAAQGQIVTQKVIDRAWAYRYETQLVNAVYYPPNLTEETPDLETKNIWQTLFNKLDFNSHREQKQIEALVGCPVNRIIFDRQDNVLLNKGEIITFNAIRQAKKKNVLNILLNSVDTKVCF